MLKIEVEYGEGTLVLRCSGSLMRGGNLERLRELARTSGWTRLTMDMNKVRRIDAHGVGMLANIAEIAASAGAEFKLACVPPTVRAVLETCGLREVLEGRKRPQSCSPAA